MLRCFGHRADEVESLAENVKEKYFLAETFLTIGKIDFLQSIN